MTPPNSLLMSSSTDWVVIGTLTSDVELAIVFRASDRAFTVAYRGTSNTWVINTALSLLSVARLNTDLVWILSYTRTIYDPETYGSVAYSIVKEIAYTNGSQPINCRFFTERIIAN